MSRTYHGPRAGAEDALDELLAEVKSGRHGGADMTLAALLEVWLDAVRDDLSPTTYNEYRRLARNRIGRSLLGSESVRRISPAQIAEFYRALRRSGRAGNTIRNVHAVMRAAFDYAVLARWLDENPALRVRTPRTTKRAVRAATDDELGRLLAACHDDDPEFWTFLRLCDALGARRGELCALKRSDVDLATGLVTISRAIVHDGPGRVIEKDTKTHAARVNKLSAETLAVVADHIETMNRRAKAAGVRASRSAYLFSSRMDCSRPWKPDTVTAKFVRLCQVTGVVGVRLHDLRHRSVTRQLDRGIPAPSVAEWHGHSSTATTLGIYAHGTPEWMDEAAGLVEG